MKIRIETRDGAVFEYETPPGRFKALCALAAGGLLLGLVWIVLQATGFLGLVVLAVLALVGIMMADT